MGDARLAHECERDRSDGEHFRASSDAGVCQTPRCSHRDDLEERSLARTISPASFDAPGRSSHGGMPALNVLVLWNTQYMDDAIDHLRRSGREISDEHLARLSPLQHEHILMLGTFRVGGVLYEVPRVCGRFTKFRGSLGAVRSEVEVAGDGRQLLAVVGGADPAHRARA